MKELILISLLGIFVLALDVLSLRKLILPAIVLGLIGLMTCCALDWNHNEQPFLEYGGMLLFDNTSLAFTFVFAFLALLWFLLTRDQFATDAKRSDLYALTLFSLCGAVVMASYSSLVTLFLGVEILSIPLYVLAASDKRSVRSNEAGFKYFFLGSLASAILLFGIALVYGATGSFDLATITAALGNHSTLITMGGLMMLAGFAFKISSAPFHMWAPDVYQGSPTVFTAFMSTVVKGAAFAGMFKLFAIAFNDFTSTHRTIFVAMIVLTLLWANIVGMRQTNIKRLLAFSGISHAGFMLAFVMLGNGSDPKWLIYYVLTYSIASMISFVIVNYVESYHIGMEDQEGFKGLMKKNPTLAVAMIISLLSMAGIPPLSGFMGKYIIIGQCMRADLIGLAIIMILTSVVAMYYYLRVIMLMFTPLENAGRIIPERSQIWTIGICTLLIVVLFFGASIFEIIQWQ
jgi:NADH-quinone oxidoreductase subunit N